MALLLVVVLVAPTVVSGATFDPHKATEFRRGTITKPANGLTVVAIQGFHLGNESTTKKPARLVAFGPRGHVRWVYDGKNIGARWFYDVDPEPDGTLFVVATNPNGTLAVKLDTHTLKPIWVEKLPFKDTHDIDLIDDTHLLVANMRAYNASTGLNDDRILIWNRTSHSIQWQWLFRNHYPQLKNTDTSIGRGGTWTDDWTHVNDVDRVAPGKYLVSVRNFDQVILIDKQTGNITLRLGHNGDYGIMAEQHNPEYLTSRSGKPTILLADSENDRIVEYEHEPNGTWKRTWTLQGSLSWPRDADRLPNGDTLIVDTLNQRVIEVTPTGQIVWEVYCPWGPYDVERIPYGDEPQGPTIADMNATGTYTVHGSAGLTPGTGDRLTFADRVVATFSGTPLSGPARTFATRWSHITPWIYPVWMTGWDFLFLVVAGLVVLGWAGTEAVLARATILARLEDLLVDRW